MDGRMDPESWGAAEPPGSVGADGYGRHPMPVHAFVDETKVRGLLIVAAILEPRDLAPARTAMRSLLLPRQSRLHFAKERDSRKGQILSTVTALPIRVDVYDARAVSDERVARGLCLEQIVHDLAQLDGHRLVIEQDDSLVRSDQETLFRAVRANRAAGTLVYEHLSPRLEPLLWIPDAIAWSWVKGGAWRDRVMPVVRTVTTL